MNLKRIFVDILVIIAVLYLVFGIYLFVIQKSMLYYPNTQDFKSCIGFEDYQKVEYSGTRFYYKENSKDVFVFYHGNAGSACDRSYFKSLLNNSNDSIIFVEYAGYSNDNKTPSKKLILQDVQHIHDFIEEKSFNFVTVYGESIGSGVASYHAYLGDVDYLILVAPFSRLVDLVQFKFVIYPAFLMLTERYDNVKWDKDFKGNVLIIHGDNDVVIPNTFSKKLFESLSTEKKKYVLIKGAGHNDVSNYDEFDEAILDAIN